MKLFFTKRVLPQLSRSLHKRDYTLSTNECRDYAKNGFVVIPNLFSQEEIELVKNVIEEDESFSKEDNQIKLNDTEGGKTELSLWSKPGDGTLGMLTRSQRIVNAMRRLLVCCGEEETDVMHYHSKILKKNPEKGGVWNWHQDYGYWYKDYFLMPHMATAYIAIDNCTRANGCLKLLPGSHELGRLDHWSKGDQQGADDERVELALQRYDEVYCEMSPGDCCFFSALVLHSSMGNHSPHRRLAFASCFTRADNVQFRDAYIPCFPVDVVDDGALLRTGVATTSDEDKVMLGSEMGKIAGKKGSDYEGAIIDEATEKVSTA